jgi:hypothetical protein
MRNSELSEIGGGRKARKKAKRSDGKREEREGIQRRLVENVNTGEMSISE